MESDAPRMQIEIIEILDDSDDDDEISEVYDKRKGHRRTQRAANKKDNRSTSISIPATTTATTTTTPSATAKKPPPCPNPPSEIDTSFDLCKCCHVNTFVSMTNSDLTPVVGTCGHTICRDCPTRMRLATLRNNPKYDRLPCPWCRRHVCGRKACQRTGCKCKSTAMEFFRVSDPSPNYSLCQALEAIHQRKRGVTPSDTAIDVDPIAFDKCSKCHTKFSIIHCDEEHREHPQTPIVGQCGHTFCRECILVFQATTISEHEYATTVVRLPCLDLQKCKKDKSKMDCSFHALHLKRNIALCEAIAVWNNIDQYIDKCREENAVLAEVGAQSDATTHQKHLASRQRQPMPDEEEYPAPNLTLSGNAAEAGEGYLSSATRGELIGEVGNLRSQISKLRKEKSDQNKLILCLRAQLQEEQCHPTHGDSSRLNQYYRTTASLRGSPEFRTPRRRQANAFSHPATVSPPPSSSEVHRLQAKKPFLSQHYSGQNKRSKACKTQLIGNWPDPCNLKTPPESAVPHRAHRLTRQITKLDRIHGCNHESYFGYNSSPHDHSKYFKKLFGTHCNECKKVFVEKASGSPNELVPNTCKLKIYECTRRKEGCHVLICEPCYRKKALFLGGGTSTRVRREEVTLLR